MSTPVEGEPDPRSRRPSIGSAVGRLIAVLDRRPEADAAVGALVSIGFDRDRIELFEEARDAAIFDASGRRHGIRGRLFRLIEFQLGRSSP